MGHHRGPSESSTYCGSAAPMDTTIALQLLASACVALGLAYLIDHALAARLLAILGTVLAGAVLVVLLLT